MHRSSRSVSVLCACAFAALPATAQTFVDGASQVPSGSPFNDSCTEDIDCGDVDLDGDLDVVMANGSDCWAVFNDQNRLWINLGGTQGGTIGFFEDVTANQMPAVNDHSRDIEFVDFDSDGDLDLYTSNDARIVLQSSRWLTNLGGLQGGTAGFYVDETQARWLDLDAPSCSLAPFMVLGSGGFIDYSSDADFADLDNDGDLDLVHSSFGDHYNGGVPTRLFLNDGAGYFSEHNPSGYKLSSSILHNGLPALWAEGLQASNTMATNGLEADITTVALDVDVGDIDGDWDFDLLLSERNVSTARFFQNRLTETGQLIWRDVTSKTFPPGAFGGNGRYEQDLGDFDGDDDLDIYGTNWFDNFTDLTLRNDGLGYFGQVATLPGSMALDNGGDFGDYDNDGDLDLYVTTGKLYRNELVPSGVPRYSLTDGGIPALAATLDADWADIDNDGDYDILTARNWSLANQLLLNPVQVSDSHAPRPAHLEPAPDRLSSSVPTVVRTHVYDNAPHYVTRFADVQLEFRVGGGPWYAVSMRSSAGQVFRGEIPGALIGAIDYRVRAQDFTGNSGLSQSLSYIAGDGGCNGSPATYCTAKQSSIPGCTPSFALNGTPSASAGIGYTVAVIGVPGGHPGLFLYTTQGAAVTPIQDAFGFLCIQSGPGMFRIAPQAGSGTAGVCDGGYAVDFNQHYAAQTQDPTLVAGAKVDLQCWYRDPPNPGMANLTGAIQFSMCP